jgi:endonuclease YncB( thermonuclease family)
LYPLYAKYTQLPYHDYLSTAIGTACAIYTLSRFGRRVRNAAEVPLECYTKNKKLHGWCVAVSDSDNIRFWHAPTLFHRRPDSIDLKSRRLETINVRLAGIDAPEVFFLPP